MLLSAENSPFPRGVLLAAGVMLAFIVVTAGGARIAGFGKADIPAAKALESRSLRFEDRRDGAVTVFDSEANKLIAVLPPGTNGFARGVMRGLARSRKRADIDDSPSFILTHWNDGRVTLEDSATRQSVELEAFGPTNLGVFAHLLDKRSDLP